MLRISYGEKNGKVTVVVGMMDGLNEKVMSEQILWIRREWHGISINFINSVNQRNRIKYFKML